MHHLVYRPGHGFFVGHEYTGGIEGGPEWSRSPADALHLRTDAATAAHNLGVVRWECKDAVPVTLSDEELASWPDMSEEEVAAWEAAMEILAS